MIKRKNYLNNRDLLKEINKKFKENHLLNLNNKKAKNTIKWKPNLNLDKTIKLTIEWYKHYSLNRKKIKFKSISQIENFNKLIKRL